MSSSYRTFTIIALVIAPPVEPDGYIGEILVIQSVHPVLDQQAIRVIKKMDRWIPAYVDGVPARCSFNQPFKFSLR